MIFSVSMTDAIALSGGTIVHAWIRLEPIMLLKLPIMLLSSAPK